MHCRALPPPPAILHCGLWRWRCRLRPPLGGRWLPSKNGGCDNDDDKDEEDNGVILSGVSAIVSIVPDVVVVVDNNNKEDNGIILSGISVAVGIVASRQAVAVAKLSP